MAVANSMQRTPTDLVPYFRRYELPWSPAEDMERRFRVILRNFIIAFAIIAIVMPFLPRHATVTNTESLPERVVQLVMEPPPPPPHPRRRSRKRSNRRRRSAPSPLRRCRHPWIRG